MLEKFNLNHSQSEGGGLVFSRKLKKLHHLKSKHNVLVVWIYNNFSASLERIGHYIRQTYQTKDRTL